MISVVRGVGGLNRDTATQGARTFSLIWYSPRRVPGPSDTFVRALSVRSEVDLYADARDARREDRCRLAEDGKAHIFRQDRIRIEHVVDVQIYLRPGAPEPKDFAEPQIQSIATVAIYRPRWDDVDRDVRRAARKRPAERRQDDGIGRDEVPDHLRSGS